MQKLTCLASVPNVGRHHQVRGHARQRLLVRILLAHELAWHSDPAHMTSGQIELADFSLQTLSAFSPFVAYSSPMPLLTAQYLQNFAWPL